jgi:RNA polymerase sigma-70 factor (ECF subfamily)
LVRQAQAGSARAFRLLVQSNQQTVRLFLMRMGSDRAAADDLAQDTFVTAWTQLGLFRGEARLKTWLCRIAFRKSLMARRTAGRERSKLAHPDASFSTGAARPDLKMDLERALQSLPAERRAAVVLCLANGFSHEDAAVTLGMPLGTLKSHVLRGRQQLQSLLEESRYDD